MPKKPLRAQVYKSKKRGRFRVTWLDDAQEDLRRMVVVTLRWQWIGVVGKRQEVLEVRITLGCSPKEEEE